MKLFFDTSVFVAGLCKMHPEHKRAHAAIQTVVSRENEGFISSHSLAEIYAVLTGLPVSPRIQPAEALMLIEKNITPFFEIISLSAKEYLDCLKNTSERRISGGAVYDALILMAATKTDPDRIYTFNVKQFKDLYSSSSGLIHAP